MNRLWYGLLLAVSCFTAPLGAFAQSTDIELLAIKDFRNFDSGEVPYYLDIAGDRNVLAINAADPNYRNKFARAEHEFTGADGIYDITINAMGEIDGDGTYRLLINGVVQGVSVNSPVTTDYTIIEHTFQGIALTAPDIIGVESNAVSNDKIPEGDGFAFARGRWKSVTISEHDAGSVNADMSADLGITLSTVDGLTVEGGQAPFIVSVVNNSTTNTATKPMVEFILPDEITFNSSENCIAITTGATCTLSNLAPGDVATVSINADIDADGWLSLNASVEADQADNDRANNTATLAFEAQTQGTFTIAAPVESTEPPSTEQSASNETPASNETENNNSPSGQSNVGNTTNETGATAGQSVDTDTTQATDNGTAASDESDSGATGIHALMLLLVFGVYRKSRSGIIG